MQNYKYIHNYIQTAHYNKDKLLSPVLYLNTNEFPLPTSQKEFPSLEPGWINDDCANYRRVCLKWMAGLFFSGSLVAVTLRLLLTSNLESKNA
jgi:hypothetical protein